MSKGYAHPILLLTILVLAGVGLALFSSPKISGLVLGARNHKETVDDTKTQGIKITVVSPKSSWDLVEYVCKSQNECQNSASSGKWWATISGAPTTADGHEVFIEKSAGWDGYSYLKIAVKMGGLEGSYLSTKSGDKYLIVDLTEIGVAPPSIEFI